MLLCVPGAENRPAADPLSAPVALDGSLSWKRIALPKGERNLALHGVMASDRERRASRSERIAYVIDALNPTVNRHERWDFGSALPDYGLMAVGNKPGTPDVLRCGFGYAPALGIARQHSQRRPI
jgi:hypothetical protein